MVNCFLCGSRIPSTQISRSSKSKVHNAIFLSALRLFARVDTDLLRMYFTSLNESMRLICAAHFIYTAQHLLTALVEGGGKVSTTAESVAYINEGEIPENLLNSLNDAMRSLANDTIIKKYDICRYLNFYMRKHFGTNGWYVLQEGELQQQDQPDELQRVPEQLAANLGEETEPSMPTRYPPPAVKRGESGSSGKTATGSCFSPNETLGLDEEIEILEETKAPLLEKYYLVKGKKLLELFHIARCGCKDNIEGVVELTDEGSTPIITYITRDARKERWEGQERLPETKLYAGNAMSSIAAITTGLRMNRLQQWGAELGLGMPSRTAYYRMFRQLRPSIDAVYDKHHQKVIQTITAAYQDEGRGAGWDIAVDGAFDSRGHSAEICRVLAVDLRTKLCIHTEILDRKQTAGISGAMEKEGFHRMLQWLRARDIHINSISTDRSTVYGSEIRQYNDEFNANIKWQLDPWHLARSLYKNMMAAAKRRTCEDLRLWIEDLKSHLYEAVRQGESGNDGQLVRHYFNTCLYHVAGIHDWEKTAKKDWPTGTIKKCQHKPIPAAKQKPVLAVGSMAHDALKNIVLNHWFQKDLAMTSPLGGTSHCEQKNSLDRIYCSKDIFLPISTYPTYVKLATLHANALRFAEMRGERVVKRRFKVVRKYNNERDSYMSEKTGIEHVWRKEIFIDFLNKKKSQRSDDEDEMDVT